MKVLHICNDFCFSKVHANLYSRLDAFGIEQTVFTFYTEAVRKGRNNEFDSKRTTFVYKDILKPWHRVLFHNKINTVWESLQESVKIDRHDIVHASSLFTNGVVAYKIYKKYQIPYIVAVRTTDVDEFLRYAPHTWLIGIKTLLNASKIVFISKSIENNFINTPLVKIILSKIKDKFVLQPNGIDNYWIEHAGKLPVRDNHQLITVCRFDANKNVERLSKAVISLRSTYPDIILHLVGGGDTHEKCVLDLVEKNPQTLVFHGKKEKEVLRELYAQCCIFAMPSHLETFGLVYIEALTQNLAIICTRGQGVDGLLDSRVGEFVDSHSQQSIEDAIVRIFEHRADYLSYEVMDFKAYDWNTIAEKYIELYKQVLS